MTTASDDRVALSDLLFGFALAIDTRDWVAYRNVFTDRIDLDYSSYRPGSAGPISAASPVGRVPTSPSSISPASSWARSSTPSRP